MRGVRPGSVLGAPKILGGLLASEGGEWRRDRSATPHDGYPAVLDAIARLVHRLEDGQAAPAANPVGIGSPGFLAPRDGRIVNSNLLTLNGQAMDVALTARLGRPVRVANGAQCFVLSEATDGAGARTAPVPKAGPDVVF